MSPQSYSDELFEQKVEAMEGVTGVEQVNQNNLPYDSWAVEDATYFKAYLSDKYTRRIESYDDSIDAVETIHRQLVQIGATEVLVTETSLFIAYKPGRGSSSQ